MLDTRKALLTGAFFIVWLSAQSVFADACKLVGPSEPVSVRHVIDGDTLELRDGRRLRLIGINTPEIGRRGEASEPFAQAARRRLQQLTDARELLLSVGDEPRDHYGRTLGHLFAAGANVEAQLLREGLGYALAVPPNVELVDCHAVAERVARQGSLGVWKGAAFTPAAKVASGGFQIVRGRVQSVSKAGKYYWLELDGPLVLRIATRELGYFKELQVEKLAGSEVEARGWVIDRTRGRLKPGHKPFMLPASHPLMLQRY
ncbi:MULTISPECIES: thermonuclease family protein [Pseudomonas]|uniref:thermonuclease family protein n=1 Tax=Pseudomonas TaxID=286 RepID=UPI00123BF813|nr:MULTISPECIES: thermonuclease family protein [Pseudomonas]QIB50651.1 thermonuclease family protein [Pseudomonas sp. OIL-1]